MKLADLLVDQIVFLSTSRDSEVHPDLAVSQLEALVSGILELPPESIQEVRETIVARMVSGRGDVHDSLAEMLGMLGVDVRSNHYLALTQRGAQGARTG